MQFILKSAEEINKQMQRQFGENKEPFYDKESREVIKGLLQCYGNKEKIQSIEDTEGECNYDLLVRMANGGLNAIEVKFRDSFSSNCFESHFINQGKAYMLRRLKDQGVFHNALLTTIWNDGVIWISDIFNDEYTLETHFQNNTTNVSSETDGQKKDKVGLYYKPIRKYYYCYQVFTDGTKNRLYSKEPINIEEANKKIQDKSKLF